VKGNVSYMNPSNDVYNTSLCYSVGVGLSCLDLLDEAFGKKFNAQPIAVIDAPEPINTCKVLRELFNDLVRAHEFGIFLPSFRIFFFFEALIVMIVTTSTQFIALICGKTVLQGNAVFVLCMCCSYCLLIVLLYVVDDVGYLSLVKPSHYSW